MGNMDIFQIRKHNLQDILNLDYEGKPKLLADSMGKDGSQIARYIKARGGTPENMGASVARQIETATNKPEGWLDRVHGVAENVVPYKVEDPEDLAEEKALFFADEFERKLEIRLSSHDKRELFKRMRDRYLRQLLAGQSIPMTNEEMKAEVIELSAFAG